MSREMKYSGVPWIGDIPKVWEQIRFKYAGTMQKGKLPIETNLDGNGKPIIGASEMLGKPFRQYSTDVGVPECKASDILILWDGANAGIVATNLCGVISSTAVSYTCKDDRCNASYAFYLMKGVEAYFRDKVFGTTIPHMNASYIDDVPLLLPSLPEQQRIVSFLDRKCAEIDEMIALQEKIVEELKAYKQSVITEAITKGLNPDVPMKDSGIEWIGEIPEHWEHGRLRNLFTLHRGYDLAHEDFVNKGIPVYGSGGFMGYHNEIKVSAPNIIIGRSGSTGKLHFIRDDFWAHNTGIFVSEHKGNNMKYLYYVLSVIDMDFLATKTAVPTLDRKKIQEHAFVYTKDYQEQEEIANYLDKKCSEIDTLIRIKQSKIESLKEYKKSIIYEYATGKKEVE